MERLNLWDVHEMSATEMKNHNGGKLSMDMLSGVLIGLTVWRS